LKGKPWLSDEINRFRQIYPTLSNAEVSQKVNHSVPSVIQQAHLLGLHKTAQHISDIQRAMKKGKNKFTIDLNMLKELYLDKELSLAHVAQNFGVSEYVIRNRLKVNNIPIRSPYEASQLNAKFKGDSDKLTELYVNQGFSLQKIAKIYGVDKRIIAKNLERFYIPRRRCGQRSHKQNTYLNIYAPDNPRADHWGYVKEHLYVWEKVHNRTLPKGWVIHHLNGIKNDNRPINLVAMTRGRHTDLAMPYKKRIRELEAEIEILKKALETNQLIFGLGEN